MKMSIYEDFYTSYFGDQGIDAGIEELNLVSSQSGDLVEKHRKIIDDSLDMINRGEKSILNDLYGSNLISLTGDDKIDFEEAGEAINKIRGLYNP